MSIFTRCNNVMLDGLFYPDINALNESCIIDSFNGNILHDRYMDTDTEKDYYVTNSFALYKDLSAIKKNVRFFPGLYYIKNKEDFRICDDKIHIARPRSHVIKKISELDKVENLTGLKFVYDTKFSPYACSRDGSYDECMRIYKAVGIEIVQPTELMDYKHRFLKIDENLTSKQYGHQLIFIAGWVMYGDDRDYFLYTMTNDKYSSSLCKFYPKLMKDYEIHNTEDGITWCRIKFKMPDYLETISQIYKCYKNYTTDFFKDCTNEDEALDVFKNI